MNLPSISIIMPSYNSSRTLSECLKSIRNQNYPQEKIEILLIDGGSKDDTESIGKKYNCKFIKGGYQNNQEARKGVGLHAAIGEIVAYIDTDNIFPNKKYISQMIAPLMENPKIVASETMRYGVKKDFNLFSRYCALIGANDPVVLYLGKCDKLSWLYDKWIYTKILEDKKDYFITEFNEDNMPTMGGNGYFARRKIMLKSRCEPNEYFHIDVVLDIVRLGYDKFAMVKNEIYHNTASSLLKLTKRRITYFKEHNPAHSNRRYFIFNTKKRKDVIKLAFFVLYTVTLVQPILFSVRGYLKKRDVAWFIHPVACLCFLFAYAAATVGLRMNSHRVS